MIEKTTKCEAVVFWGCGVLLVFAPLAFGSVHVWAYSFVEIGIFSLLLLYFLDRLFFTRAERLEWVKTPLNLFLILFVLLILFQLIPLPESILSSISPKTSADKSKLIDILSKAGRDVSSLHFLAYYRHRVITELLKLLAYMAMFFLVLNTLKSKKKINTLIYLLIIIGLFETVYAVYQVFSVTPKIWWWTKTRTPFASGTFIVSNHFAGYLEMVLPLCVGFMIANRQRNKRLQSGLKDNRFSLNRLIDRLSPESANPRMIFLFFCSILMAVALLLSGSRGGIIAIGISMGMISILFFTKKRYRSYGYMVICLLIVGAIYASNIGISATLDKFEQTEGLHRRLYTSKTMVPMLLEYPVSGVGWGNFKYLYKRHVATDYDGISSSGYLHNDWLEAGIETGFLGGVLIVAGYLVFTIKLVRIWRRRRDSYAIGVGAGVLTAMAAIGAHSIFDLNMHIPSNPLTLAAVLAIGYAAIHRQHHGVKEAFFYRTRSISMTRPRRILLSIIILAAFGLVFHGVKRHFWAEAKSPGEWNATLNLNRNPFLAEIRTAAARNPDNSLYDWKEAWLFMKARTKNKTTRKEYNEGAIQSLENAVQKNPARADFWFYLGKRYSFRSYEPEGYLKRWLPLADECFDMAVKCAPVDSKILFDVAWYWVWRSRLFPKRIDFASAGGSGSTVRIRDEGINKFQGLFQRSIEINPDRLKKAADRVWEYYPDDSIVLGIVPEENEKMQRQLMRYLAKKPN